MIGYRIDSPRTFTWPKRPDMAFVPLAPEQQSIAKPYQETMRVLYCCYILDVGVGSENVLFKRVFRVTPDIATEYHFSVLP